LELRSSRRGSLPTAHTNQRLDEQERAEEQNGAADGESPKINLLKSRYRRQCPETIFLDIDRRQFLATIFSS
jgi:hypothetical protein